MIRKLTTSIRRHAGWLPAAASITLLLACALGARAEPPVAARYRIEQPAQALADSLHAIARQTGTSVLFDPAAVSGRIARPVSGSLSPIEAITAALQGSGLTAAVMGDGAIVVRAGAPSPTTPPAAAGSAASVRVPARSEDRGAGTPAASPAAAPLAAGEGATATASASDAPTELTRVEVTGSRLKRVSAEGPAPVNVYTRSDIDKSGQPNLQRFLASLNEVSAASGEGGFASTLGQGTVQLRGLPLGSTLVLINGRRVQAVGSSSGNFFNLNLIPMAAVERVEIVPVGSSAVYGGDALAGVVNVILKKSVDGLSLVARLGSGRGLGDGSVSMAMGGKDADGSYLLMGSYSRSTPLTMAERAFFRDADYRRFGGEDARVDNCTPGTVRSATGANLPGLNASFAGIPTLASGAVPKVSDFAASAGKENLCNLWANGTGISLVNGYETVGLHALGERRISNSWSAFAELTFANEHMQAKDIGLTLTDVSVPAGNPFNPFGEDVQVTTILGPDNGAKGFARQTKFTRALVGLRGELGGDWDAELTLSTLRDRGGSQTVNINADGEALAAALAAQAPADALNPFTTGRAASDAVLRGIWSDTVRRSRGRKDQAGALVRGSLAQLPAGPVEVSLGAESARDHYDVSITGRKDTHDSRNDSAAFGELRAPLLRSGGEGHGTEALAALTLAARRDRYTDFGAANTYQAGLEVRPSRGILIRASGASSFKPPTMLQTHVNDTSFPAEFFGLVDPARGGEDIVSGTVVRTTNKALGPERGRAQGIGAVWEPEGSLGTRFGLTHWQVRIKGLIAVLQAQSALDHEDLFPGFVSRAASTDGQPGKVTSVKVAEVNFGSVDAAGTDLESAYAWRDGAGRWTVSAAATRTNRYRVVLAPGAGVEDRLGVRFEDFWAPRWKGRLSVGLDRGAWSAGLTSRYLGGYRDADGNRKLGNYWVHDLAGSLNLKKCWPALFPGFKAASLVASVANVADREPQYVQGLPYYDLTQADWRGRYASVQLTLDW